MNHTIKNDKREENTDIHQLSGAITLVRRMHTRSGTKIQVFDKTYAYAQDIQELSEMIGLVGPFKTKYFNISKYSEQDRSIKIPPGREYLDVGTAIKSAVGLCPDGAIAIIQDVKNKILLKIECS